jgi:hypothetical protein
MNETRGPQRAWTPEETAALLAAVQQCRTAGGQLDWHAIAATIPGRGAQSAAVQFYKLLPTACTRPTAPMPRNVT